MLRYVVCVFAAFSFTVAIALAGEKSASDAKDLQGTWQAVDIEANGEKSPADPAKKLQLVIKADQIAVNQNDETKTLKFKLDPGKTPRTLDLTLLDGPDKGKTVLGIYALQDGRLRLCLNIFGKDPAKRPTEFKTQEGDGVVIATLESKK